MKTLIASIAGLAVGLVLGFYSGNRSHHNHIADEAARQMVESGESAEAMTAVVAAAAVRYIDCGEISNAVLVLSHPMASYYSSYGIRAGTNAQRLKVRNFIDQVALTNQMVAAQIKKEMEW